MKNDLKLKILLLGPSGSGKTSIANFLSDATENINGDIRPTKGVRIVEFEGEGWKLKNSSVRSKVDIELWDCSGDRRYEACWPAFFDKTDGIIFVYNSNTSAKALEFFYNYFVEQTGFSVKNCALFYHWQSANEKPEKTPTSPIPTLNLSVVNIEENGSQLRTIFNAYILSVLQEQETNKNLQEQTILSE